MRNTSFDDLPSARAEPTASTGVFVFGLDDEPAVDVAAAEAELERGAVDCLAVNCALGALAR